MTVITSDWRPPRYSMREKWLSLYREWRRGRRDLVNGTPDEMARAMLRMSPIGYGLAGLPTDADVQAAATAALNAYDPPTKAEMDAGFAGVSTSGAGSETVTLTSTDNSSVPLEGVAVWVTSDSAGAAVVAGTLYSNTLGVTTFYLDPGTYYAWRQGGGVNWTNPQTITVVDA